MHRNSQQRYRSFHVTRVMATTAASTLLLLLLVRYWPISDGHDPTHLTYQSPAPELIAMEEVVPTMQRRKPPPPPAPLPPVIMPEDRILDDPPLLDADLLPVDQFGPPEPSAAEEKAPQNALRADSGPKPVRIAEPEYPRAARRRNIRAEITLRVDIDQRGRVTAYQITNRFLLGEDGLTRQPVEALGFGLEEAAINAANRWLFRPARKQGEPVRSQYALSIKFGV